MATATTASNNNIMVPNITLMSGSEVSSRATRAHEMKNCISVILAVSRLVSPELSAQSCERVTRLQSAAWRLHDLLADDLSEEVSVCDEPTTPSSVATLVEETIVRVADRAAEAHVELFVQCGGGEIYCEERTLGEALFNLLTNAIEASPPGAAVLVATYIANDGDQYWVVQDMGAGIPAEQLADLGQPFHTTKSGGSGLGFALARAAIAAHGGLLRVESSAGAGTTVSIWLPHRSSSSSSSSWRQHHG